MVDSVDGGHSMLPTVSFESRNYLLRRLGVALDVGGARVSLIGRVVGCDRLVAVLGMRGRWV